MVEITLNDYSTWCDMLGLFGGQGWEAGMGSTSSARQLQSPKFLRFKKYACLSEQLEQCDPLADGCLM